MMQYVPQIAHVVALAAFVARVEVLTLVCGIAA